jgi:hypothetical protein
MSALELNDEAERKIAARRLFRGAIFAVRACAIFHGGHPDDDSDSDEEARKPKRTPEGHAYSNAAVCGRSDALLDCSVFGGPTKRGLEVSASAVQRYKDLAHEASRRARLAQLAAPLRVTHRGEAGQSRRDEPSPATYDVSRACVFPPVALREALNTRGRRRLENELPGMRSGWGAAPALADEWGESEKEDDADTADTASSSTSGPRARQRRPRRRPSGTPGPGAYAVAAACAATEASNGSVKFAPARTSPRLEVTVGGLGVGGPLVLSPIARRAPNRRPGKATAGD